MQLNGMSDRSSSRPILEISHGPAGCGKKQERKEKASSSDTLGNRVEFRQRKRDDLGSKRSSSVTLRAAICNPRRRCMTRFRIVRMYNRWRNKKYFFWPDKRKWNQNWKLNFPCQESLPSFGDDSSDMHQISGGQFVHVSNCTSNVSAFCLKFE